jgi:hypothetical protein
MTIIKFGVIVLFLLFLFMCIIIFVACNDNNNITKSITSPHEVKGNHIEPHATKHQRLHHSNQPQMQPTKQMAIISNPHACAMFFKCSFFNGHARAMYTTKHVLHKTY